jgi:hypothetical protein
MTAAWRVGTKIPINVYDGDTPVCQCQTVEYAKLIVESVNFCLKAEADWRQIAESEQQQIDDEPTL